MGADDATWEELLLGRFAPGWINTQAPVCPECKETMKCLVRLSWRLGPGVGAVGECRCGMLVIQNEDKKAIFVNGRAR